MTENVHDVRYLKRIEAHNYNRAWPGGGGGGVTRDMTGYAPMSPKSVERVCFSDIGVVDFV